MYNNVPPQLWMLLYKEQREILEKEFNIPRTGACEIYDNRVISDGRTVDDLKVITLEKMNLLNKKKTQTFL